ncbi:hypothetical protein OS122_02405 [Mycolicibacterium mucogenicum]|uniref:hypothetical protein n=1 Tax=Mycolicibacterium mucogenicum TaxID=56689 RepID=UPI00226AC9FC|nr:hypothetical protein [Mycolicibacterium mucogenicum]MCX8559750.1 hypothetical protein [Mycolicibacterium mucogenicum]
MTLSQIVTVLTPLLGGQLAFGIFSWLRNRKNDAAEAARKQKLDEAAAVQAEKDRQVLLAESQRIAQQTALDSANATVAQVERRCNKCIEELQELRDITGQLIDRLEELMDNDTVESRTNARATIRVARRAM